MPVIACNLTSKYEENIFQTLHLKVNDKFILIAISFKKYKYRSRVVSAAPPRDLSTKTHVNLSSLTHSVS